jgi:sec-independent protein translocase protein TatA
VHAPFTRARLTRINRAVSDPNAPWLRTALKPTNQEEPMLGLDNPTHLAFLFVLLLLVFGAKRLPELGRSLGSGLRGFKETVSGESETAQLEPTEMAAAQTHARGSTDALPGSAPSTPVG